MVMLKVKWGGAEGVRQTSKLASGERSGWYIKRVLGVMIFWEGGGRRMRIEGRDWKDDCVDVLEGQDAVRVRSWCAEDV
ncbi:uncharacterized protein RSE6_12862 [Rhynchosporium secalis]|uniref:Uncharacterized protein n=1 Tax=Rhynchosporium secalis TaxID=38038 RepID=A0A1E1MRG1_RHYSE|nr:uncharacterized protein RSE6_12862 [Rhynchosporium secalis]